MYLCVDEDLSLCPRRLLLSSAIWTVPCRMTINSLRKPTLPACTCRFLCTVVKNALKL